MPHAGNTGNVQAHKWYNLAASQGHKNAPANRDLVEKRMTLGQLADAHLLAHEWRAKFKKRKGK